MGGGGGGVASLCLSKFYRSAVQTEVMESICEVSSGSVKSAMMVLVLAPFLPLATDAGCYCNCL